MHIAGILTIVKHGEYCPASSICQELLVFAAKFTGSMLVMTSPLVRDLKICGHLQADTHLVPSEDGQQELFNLA